MSYYDDDLYYISSEEEREMEEAERYEIEREEEERKEAEAAAWLASRRWWWHTYKWLSWRLYWAPRMWLLRNTALGRRYINLKIVRDRARRLNALERQLRKDFSDDVPF